MYNSEFSMMSIITEVVYICFKGPAEGHLREYLATLKTHWCIGSLRLLPALWSGSCRFDTFSISFPNFIYLLWYNFLEVEFKMLIFKYHYHYWKKLKDKKGKCAWLLMLIFPSFTVNKFIIIIHFVLYFYFPKWRTYL